jgi:hypothetical protein
MQVNTQIYRKHTNNISVVVCFCVYNNEKGLPSCLRNMEEIRHIFHRMVINVVYDISEDSSYQILVDFNKKNENKSMIEKIPVNIVTNTIERNVKSKSENIAKCRNILLDMIRKHYSNYDYFIMMDTNDYSCIGQINVQLMHDIMHPEYDDDDDDDVSNNHLGKNISNYDAITFDREAGYYDWWALSFDPYIYSFYHISNSFKVNYHMKKMFTNILHDYRMYRRNEVIPVYSAFNGFGIYKIKKFLDCSYSSDIQVDLFPKHIVHKLIHITKSNIYNHFKDDCEHRKFHLEAIRKNNAKIGVSTRYMFFKHENPPPNLRGPA